MSLLPEGYDIEKAADEFGKAPPPVPNGDYTAMIVSADRMPTRDGINHILVLVFQIVNGEHKGRKVITRLNLWHSSLQTVEISQRELSKIIACTIRRNPNSADELKSIPVIISVAVEERKDKPGTYVNVITDYTSVANGYSEPMSPPSGGAPWGS